MKNIKEEYKKDLNIFLGIHIVLIYILVFGFNINDVKVLFKEEIYKSIFILTLPFISIALNGILPNYIKEFIVFWKFKNRLPGYQAFSKYAKTDHRINIDKLKIIYPEIIKENFNENKLWYKIYKKHVEYPSVWDAQKNYLLTRDMANLTIIFILVISIIDIFMDVSVYYYIGLVFEYLLLIIASRNYAIKFVTNVLAEESVK